MKIAGRGKINLIYNTIKHLGLIVILGQTNFLQELLVLIFADFCFSYLFLFCFSFVELRGKIEKYFNLREDINESE